MVCLHIFEYLINRLSSPFNFVGFEGAEVSTDHSFSNREETLLTAAGAVKINQLTVEV